MILFMFMKYMHNPAKKEEYLHLAVNVHVFASEKMSYVQINIKKPRQCNWSTSTGRQHS